jgi:hypothetical protein
MPKKDTAAQRLKKAIASARAPQPEFSLPKLPNFSLFWRNSRNSQPADFNNPIVRRSYADVATKLWPCGDEPLRAAFAAFGLDPNNPLDWSELLRIFAKIHFKPAAKRGPKRKWNDRDQIVLQIQAELIKRDYPTAKNQEVAKRIKDRWEYSQPIETLQRYLYGVPQRRRSSAKH